MIFHRVDPNPEYRSLRLLSEEGRWELGLSEYHSGTRLRMGFIGRPPSLLDFCLGHDTQIYTLVLLAVMECLKGLPESASTTDIDALFPWAGTRPDLSIHLHLLLQKHGQ